MLALGGARVPSDRVLDGVNVLAVLEGKATRVERPQPLFWRLHMAPNAKVAMRVDDWKILADAGLTEFELYDLKSDPRETTDLKEREAARFNALRAQLVRHNAAIDAEGPDWWRRLSPNGGTDPAATKAGKKDKKQ
jgi:arylsulfatase A-like enzyme